MAVIVHNVLLGSPDRDLSEAREFLRGTESINSKSLNYFSLINFSNSKLLFLMAGEQELSLSTVM